MSQRTWQSKLQSMASSIGAFVAHLDREKPRTIEELYSELEKYCRFDNDLIRRLEEQNQSIQYQGSSRNAQRGNKN